MQARWQDAHRSHWDMEDNNADMSHVLGRFTIPPMDRVGREAICFIAILMECFVHKYLGISYVLCLRHLKNILFPAQ